MKGRSKNEKVKVVKTEGSKLRKDMEKRKEVESKEEDNKWEETSQQEEEEEANTSIRVNRKSIIVAYLCWAVGGIAGLHHFYLGRVYQGFAWWTTGGGFYFGFVRDFWRIKSYVAEANFDVTFVRSYLSEIRYSIKPAFSSSRFVGMVSVGMFYGYLAQFAVPENCFGLNLHEHKFVWLLVVPLAIGVGNYIIGNIGFHEVPFKWCWAGACVPSVFLPINPDITSYASLFSTVISYWHRDYRRSITKKQSSIFTYIGVILGMALYVYMWYSMLYHNVSVTTVDGEKIYFRQLVAPYFDKKDMAEIMIMLKTDIFKVWKEMRSQVHSVHLLEDTQAYKVLGLEWGANDVEITTKFRELAKQFHPDKLRAAAQQKNPLGLATAADEYDYNQRMIEITNAYDTLIKKKARHAARPKTPPVQPQSSIPTSNGDGARVEL